MGALVRLEQERREMVTVGGGKEVGRGTRKGGRRVVDERGVCGDVDGSAEEGSVAEGASVLSVIKEEGALLDSTISLMNPPCHKLGLAVVPALKLRHYNSGTITPALTYITHLPRNRQPE